MINLCKGCKIDEMNCIVRESIYKLFGMSIFFFINKI